jgi:anthranilate synthase component 1
MKMARVERKNKEAVAAESSRPSSVLVLSRELDVAADRIHLAHERLVPEGAPGFLMEREEAAYLFFRPYRSYVVRDGRLTIQEAAGTPRIEEGNPLEQLRAELESFTVEGSPVRFAAGAVGYVGYDCVRYLERIPLPETPAGEDEACFVVFRDGILFDRARGKATLVSRLFAEDGEAERTAAHAALDRMEAALRAPGEVTALETEPGLEVGLPASVDPARFTDAVGKIREHIRRGDIFQCVLSERMEYPLECSTREVFRALRAQGAAPYTYFFEAPGQVLLGASPELLVKVEDGTVETCPIAGTRPRGVDAADEARLERQLLRSPKERAEHLMLVDLSRNDLGRVCEPGTVRVKDFMQVRRFSHVMHLVSTVVGRLRGEHSALSALFSAFPAGTLTGAPKIRAMEIISRLEKQRRGAYGGSVVMLDFRGALDSCITIRSLVARDGKISVQAGAGIVADSSAKRELDEIAHKSRAARRALGLAAKRQEER